MCVRTIVMKCYTGFLYWGRFESNCFLPLSLNVDHQCLDSRWSGHRKQMQMILFIELSSVQHGGLGWHMWRADLLNVLTQTGVETRNNSPLTAPHFSDPFHYFQCQQLHPVVPCNESSRVGRGHHRAELRILSFFHSCKQIKPPVFVRKHKATVMKSAFCTCWLYMTKTGSARTKMRGMRPQWFQKSLKTTLEKKTSSLVLT